MGCGFPSTVSYTAPCCPAPPPWGREGEARGRGNLELPVVSAARAMGEAGWEGCNLTFPGPHAVHGLPVGQPCPSPSHPVFGKAEVQIQIYTSPSLSPVQMFLGKHDIFLLVY